MLHNKYPTDLETVQFAMCVSCTQQCYGIILAVVSELFLPLWTY